MIFAIAFPRSTSEWRRNIWWTSASSAASVTWSTQEEINAFTMSPLRASITKNPKVRDVLILRGDNLSSVPVIALVARVNSLWAENGFIVHRLLNFFHSIDLFDIYFCFLVLISSLCLQG